MEKARDLNAEILAYIENADDIQLNRIMDVISDRYRKTFPEWEVIYIAVHREVEQQKRDIDAIGDYLYRSCEQT